MTEQDFEQTPGSDGDGGAPIADQVAQDLAPQADPEPEPIEPQEPAEEPADEVASEPALKASRMNRDDGQRPVDQSQLYSPSHDDLNPAFAAPKG